MSEQVEASTMVTYEYRGRTWEFPADVVEIQRRWNIANAEVKRLERATDSESLAAYRQAWEACVAATHAKLEHPWIAALGIDKHQADPALRACANQE